MNSNVIFSQTQACPTNFNFGMGNLTDWAAYTGNNKNGNGASAIKTTYYNLTTGLPSGTLNVTAITEYGIGATGIQVNTVAGTDPFGFFTTIPTINGYKYTNSVTLGSTNVSTGNGSNGGGYIRGISYSINVPTSTVVQPYTITYAYAMVLENGSHATSQQPQFTATLVAGGNVVSCASPQYTLPTLGNTNSGGTGATLDTAAARQEGFTLSSVPSPNPVNAGQSQYRVYTKGWNEVTLDLSPYRGQIVTLTFEADNCVPGGHFSYSYIALRNVCAGLQITGDTAVCSASLKTYSIPALAGATYNWTIPPSWIVPGQDPNNPNIILVAPQPPGGQIIAHEQNSCADLYDTINVSVYSPIFPGVLTPLSTQVCSGANSSVLNLAGNTGSIKSWISSTTNGLTWNNIFNTSNTYTATNLTATTLYKVLVQGNQSCPSDTSNAAIIKVDKKTVGGTLTPANTNICNNQNIFSQINLTGNIGNVLNWQSSTDNGATWNNFLPQKTDSSLSVNSYNTGAWQYRVINKNGVCPTDTSTIATITLIPVSFPSAVHTPIDTNICFATTAQLNTTINVGTNYNWISGQPFTGTKTGTLSNTPSTVSINAHPVLNSSYYINIQNSGCPNVLTDTFKVNVYPKINVFAGNDTSVVLGQPLLFKATADSSAISYLWQPTTGLNDPNILNPMATIYDAMLNGNYYITYYLTVANAIGCTATDSFVVRIFKIGPSIFVPNAFTPNGDGKNDKLIPILAGIAKLNYFRIYNRFGNLVYNTEAAGEGWDGTYEGMPQAMSGYVYVAQAVDYTGKIINQKGNIVLVR